MASSLKRSQLDGPIPKREKRLISMAIKVQDRMYQQSVEDSKFCDVTLFIGDSVIKAHWSMLTGIPYFEALYDSGMNESLTGEVRLTYGDEDAMKAAIRFLYTGKLTLSMETIRHLLEVADYLMMEDLTAECLKFLKEVSITMGSCAQIMLLSSQYNLEENYTTAHKYVCGHLPELLRGDQLLDMTKDSVLSFFKDRTLSYVQREDFFNFLVRWTERDLENRAEHFPELFQTLNFLLVTERFLTDTVLCHPLVKQSDHCLRHCQKAENRGSTEFSPCGSAIMQDIIIIGGGNDEKWSLGRDDIVFEACGSSRLQAYFPLEDRCVTLPDLPYVLGKPLMAVTKDGKLLVTDCAQGRNSPRAKRILSYCFRQNKWTLLRFVCPQENFDYEFHSLHSCNGRLFVVASSKTFDMSALRSPRRSKRLKSTETVLGKPRHNVEILQLVVTSTSASLTVRRGIFQRSIKSEIHVTCGQKRDRTTLDGDFIYIKGTQCFDYSGPDDTAGLTKLVVYDVEKNRCQEVQKKLAIKTLSLGLPEGLLGCDIGALIGQLVSQTAEVIGSKNYAIPPAPFAAPRQRLAYTSVDQQLYVFGGKPDKEWTARSVAKYCFTSKTWTFLGYLHSPVHDSGITRARIPSDLLRCHMDCPHCHYTLKREPAYDKSILNDLEVSVALLRHDLDSSDDSDWDSDGYYDYGSFLF